MKILNGKELAGFIKERQAHQVASLEHKPTLLILRDNDSPVINKYVTLKKKYGEDIGIKVLDICTNVYSKKSEAKRGEDEHASPVVTGASDALREEILRANINPDITAIILQLPITDQSQTDTLTNLIDPQKDVDGLGKHSKFDSATATAILWLLAGYDINLDGQKIALVGHGKLVGTPLEIILKNSHRDVTVFHKGDDLTKLKNFDIIISATGVPDLISDSMVRPGAVLIDAGTASENGVIKGDASEAVRNRTDLTAITPLKGGVGPLTVTCLFDHVIQTAQK